MTEKSGQCRIIISCIITPGCFVSGVFQKLCLKVQHILQVWNGGHGIISLHCFQNVIPVEAYTREACMVDAIGTNTVVIWQRIKTDLNIRSSLSFSLTELKCNEFMFILLSGLKMLTNQKRGDYYGMVSTWPAKRQRELGVHLLYRAMQIFLAEGERQLRPADIRRWCHTLSVRHWALESTLG